MAGWYDAEVNVSHCDGFVLCGGRSQRMGRDKALLRYGNVPLVVHVAQQVREATGSATLVGSRALYGHLGWPVIEDEPGERNGPLGGMIAALAQSPAERNLIVACDMPWLQAAALADLVHFSSAADVVCARVEGRWLEPLCAVYHRRCLPMLRQALGEGERAVRRILSRLTVEEWPVADGRLVANANTPEDWAVLEAAT